MKYLIDVLTHEPVKKDVPLRQNVWIADRVTCTYESGIVSGERVLVNDRTYDLVWNDEENYYELKDR